jgi:hypothetical protein
LLESTAHVALAAATALAWFGLGSVILAPLVPSGDRGLDALNRFGAGAIAFSLLTLLAGWLGLLSAAAYVPLFVAAAAVGAFAASRLLVGAPRLDRSAWPKWQLVTAALIGVYAVAAVVVTCAPISSADALFYHAALPEQFERAGRIDEVPWVWQSYQPFLVQMLVVDGFLLWDSVQGAFAPLLLGLGAAAVVAQVAFRLGGRAIALLATAVFVAQPFALWLLTSTFVEPGGAFMVALACANVVRFAASGRSDALALAGAFTGATASVKYVAATAAGVLALFALPALVAMGRRVRAGHAVVFVLAAVAVALPWYAKNALTVGDPFYPLMGWPSEEARLEAEATFDNFGHGRSPGDLALLPVRLLADAERFNRAEYITPLFLLFAPLSLLARSARRASALVLVAAGLYVLAWFVSVQDARYLFFVMPPLGVLAAVGIVALARRGRFGAYVSVTAAVAAFAVGAAVSAVYASRFALVVSGRESEDAFLRRMVPYHDATVWLNDNLPPEARVALDHSFVLHVDRPALSWTSDALPTTEGRQRTQEFFRSHRLTHVLVFSSNVARHRQLRYVEAVPVARVTVRNVTSRGLGRLGPEETMEVYRVGDRFSSPPASAEEASLTTPSAHASGVKRAAISREREPN